MTGWELQLLDANKNKVAVLWNPFSGTDATTCVVTETVEAEDVLTFSTPNLAHKDLLLNDGVIHLLRLVNLSDPSEIRTYQIEHVDLIHETEQELLDIRATRIWMWLKNRYIYAQKREFANMTLGTVLNELITGSGADASFQLGTIEKENDIVDFFEINHHSVLWGLRQLCTKMGCEMSIDESFTPVKLNFPTAIGNANSIARLRYGTNLQGIRKSVSRTKQVTRLYGVGGGTPPLTLSDAPKSAPTHLAYLDDPTYNATTNNYTDVYNNPELENIANLILPSENPDFSGDYDEGLIEGWAKLGDPDVFENTEKKYIEHGTKSQKIEAGTDAGLQISVLIPEEARNQNLVFWMHFFVHTIDPLAVIQMEFDSGSGTYKFRAGEEAVPASSVPTTGGFYSIERRNIKTPLESCTLKIYSEGGPATFYLDAAFLGVGDEFKKFVIGNMADVLYDECVAELGKRNTPEVTYVVDALDLYETDPKKWANYQFRLGDDVTVEDLKVGIITQQRVKSRTWNVLYPEQSGFQVGNVIRTQAMMAANNALQFRDIIEQTRNSQGRSDANGRAGFSNAPQSSQPARYSKAFTSTSHNSLSYEGGGVVTIGADLSYTLAATAGSFTGLNPETSYYLYFDMNGVFDDPPTPFGITDNIDQTLLPQRAIVAYVETGKEGDPGLSIITAGRPQLSGDHLITGQIDANKCVIESPGNLPIHINGTGIYSGSGYESGDSTFGIGANTGSVYLGINDPTNNKYQLKWDANNETLTVPGQVVTTGIDAANLTIGQVNLNSVSAKGTDPLGSGSYMEIDASGIRGFKSDGGSPPTYAQRFDLKTDGTGWLGNETTGIKWANDGTLEVGASVTIGSSIDSSLMDSASPPDHDAVIIDSNGIRGYHYTTSAIQTFELHTDGSGQLGIDDALNDKYPITWGTDGKVEVPGGIVTSGIDANNINSGILHITDPESTDPATEPNRIDMSWEHRDIKFYKTGYTNEVIDLGNIEGETAGGNESFGTIGMTVAHPQGMLQVYRQGDVGNAGSGLFPTAILSVVDRGIGQAHPDREIGIWSHIEAQAPSSGNNGILYPFAVSGQNEKGEISAFSTISAIKGTTKARGIELSTIQATDNTGKAYGIKVETVTGGLSTGGEAYGIHIANSIDAADKYAIYSEADEDSYFAGKVETNSDFELAQSSKGIAFVPATADGGTPSNDTTAKRLRLVKLASPPTNSAYIAFSNTSYGFYLILEDA